MTLPTISFLLPHLGDTPRRRDGLEACIESIRALDYPSALIDIDILDGPGTVPEKIVKGVQETDGEFLCYAANDMTFNKDCLKQALKCSKENNKAMVSFNSGPLYPDMGNAAEHFIIRRDFLPELEDGMIFHTSFSHYGCDNWLMAQALNKNQFLWCEEAIIHHDHFSKGGEFDAVYNKAMKNVEADRENLRKKLETF